MFGKLKSRFVRDEEAGLTVEAVIILPLLLWALMAMYAFYDVYRHKMLAMKANYAISDLLSRETDPINLAYINGIEDVYEFYTRSSDGDAWIRVTPVKCRRRCNNLNTRQLQRDWSRGTDGQVSLRNGVVNRDYRDLIPLVPKGERIIMVETELTYEPLFGDYFTPIGERTMRDVVFTRPRFSPQLCWGTMSCLN
jgi:hypothetical protein